MPNRPPSNHEPGDVVGDPSRMQALADCQILDTEPEAAFDGIVKLAAAVCAAPVALLVFVDHERQWFKAETGLGVREAPLDASAHRHALLEADLLMIDDTRNDPRISANPLLRLAGRSLRSYAGALLKSGPYPLGMLCVLDKRPRAFGSGPLEALALMRDQVAHLLELRRSHLAQHRIVRALDEARNELQRQVHRDPLTGLLNRRALESRLQLALESMPAEAPCGAVLMLDLNEFKQINDTYGHLCGDRVLKRVAELLREATRARDVIGRWGGDEFLLLLPSTDLQQALDVAERISYALARDFSVGHAGGRISASIGIVPMTGFQSVAGLVHTVDTAMYEAKRSGGGGPRIKLTVRPA